MIIGAQKCEEERKTVYWCPKSDDEREEVTNKVHWRLKSLSRKKCGNQQVLLATEKFKQKEKW